MMAIGLMNMAGSCSSCYITTGDYLFVNYPSLIYTVISHRNQLSWFLITFRLIFYRIIFSICCELQCRGANNRFKHCNVVSSACNSFVPHAAVYLHSKFHLGRHHHNRCDWTDWLSSCISLVESWQARFLGLHMFLSRCSLHFGPLRSSNCCKFFSPNTWLD